MYKYIILGCLCVGFAIGWIFPVEGPYDESYEQLTTIKKKSAVKAAPKTIKKEILIDLDEDNIPEWYTLIPQSFVVGE